MKSRYIISIFVIIAALAIAFLDGGAFGTALTVAGGLPFVSIDFDGDDNLPGIARGYFIKTSEIVNEAVPMVNPTTALEAITIVGSHILDAAKYFSEMYSTQGKGTLKFEPEGGRDFENFKVSGTLFFPCTKEESLGLSAAVLGQDIVILLEENSDSDFFLQVGNLKLPARFVSSGDWGTELNDEKGITFNFEAFHGKKTPYIYRGVIPLAIDNIVS